ncbi:ABC transporter substrate-binding protein [Mycolicibacterium peregrinum]|uniref:Spermidine/putrecine ABC transporter substrate-binding protein n=1 Tax=Mycolicibacterium peregrinum TaxID=43304 RepID=A0A1A0VQ06_MYCPR|nr:spermidine/putrescine ABC transporter substrate-binding protein [Mycolicibacterium peregrinum]OBB85276.1 spermidine/putrecine ABC transporter substrate-binding protein [Mycolicibacterium peregrinum]
MRNPRRIACSAVLVLAVSALSACGGGGTATDINNAAATDKLNVYAWDGEVPESVVEAFEKETGVDVTIDTFDSNETMISKLAAGASGYDIVQPSQYAVQQLVGQNLIQELNHGKIDGLNNLGEKWRNTDFDPDNRHSIPWVWGTTGIGYNDQCVKQAPSSWKALWDPQYKGKMYMLDNMLAAYIAALQINGYAASSTDQAEINKATESLVEQKPLLAGYNATNYTDLLDTGQACIAQAWSGTTMAKVLDSNPNVHYVLPEEGGTLWTDTFAVAKGAPNILNAYKWLSFTLRPEIAAMGSNDGDLATPNEAALPLVRPELRNNGAVYQSAEAIADADFVLDPGKAMPYFQQGWTKVKAS